MLHVFFTAAAGGEDVFLTLRDPTTGESLGIWQGGSDGSERLYALDAEESAGDLIVGGYTTGSVFSANGELPFHRRSVGLTLGLTIAGVRSTCRFCKGNVLCSLCRCNLVV